MTYAWPASKDTPPATSRPSGTPFLWRALSTRARSSCPAANSKRRPPPGMPTVSASSRPVSSQVWTWYWLSPADSQSSRVVMPKFYIARHEHAQALAALTEFGTQLVQGLGSLAGAFFAGGPGIAEVAGIFQTAHPGRDQVLQKRLIANAPCLGNPARTLQHIGIQPDG